jgi:hypothetical protein
MDRLIDIVGHHHGRDLKPIAHGRDSFDRQRQVVGEFRSLTISAIGMCRSWSP